MRNDEKMVPPLNPQIPGRTGTTNINSNALATFSLNENHKDDRVRGFGRTYTEESHQTGNEVLKETERSLPSFSVSSRSHKQDLIPTVGQVNYDDETEDVFEDENENRYIDTDTETESGEEEVELQTTISPEIISQPDRNAHTNSPLQRHRRPNKNTTPRRFGGADGETLTEEDKASLWESLSPST